MSADPSLLLVNQHDWPVVSFRLVLSTFHDRTGVPMVLNTSLDENEPIVHRPEEALDCFLRTDMDVLAMGPWLVRKAAARDGTEVEDVAADEVDVR